MTRNALLPAYLALGAVCFFWGTTYLAIRMALESFPPMLLVCSRYLLSGGLMAAGVLWRRDPLPRGRDWRAIAFSGILILGVGNGCLVFSELLIPSGMAGLILTISPFWMVGIEALLPGGERLHLPTILGMAVGLFGASLLFAPDLGGDSVSTRHLAGFLLLQVGMAGWSFGSIYQRRQAGRAHPIVVGAMQQCCAGLALLPLAASIPGHPIHWSVRGAGAILYLAVFGSIVGYSAYVFALDRLPVAVVSIYPYVNAVVAVTLGWLFYREPFGIYELFAMLTIFAGVGLVKRYTPPPKVRAVKARPPEAAQNRSC